MSLEIAQQPKILLQNWFQGQFVLGIFSPLIGCFIIFNQSERSKPQNIESGPGLRIYKGSSKIRTIATVRVSLLRPFLFLTTQMHISESRICNGMQRCEAVVVVVASAASTASNTRSKIRPQWKVFFLFFFFYFTTSISPFHFIA